MDFTLCCFGFSVKLLVSRQNLPASHLFGIPVTSFLSRGEGTRCVWQVTCTSYLCHLAGKQDGRLFS
jgi:hypothetical protein